MTSFFTQNDEHSLSDIVKELPGAFWKIKARIRAMFEKDEHWAQVTVCSGQ